MRKVRQIQTKGKTAGLTTVPRPAAEGAPSVQARVALIQALVPLGVEKMAEELAQEFDRLASSWYARTGGDPPAPRRHCLRSLSAATARVKASTWACSVSMACCCVSMVRCCFWNSFSSIGGRNWYITDSIWPSLECVTSPG